MKEVEEADTRWRERLQHVLTPGRVAIALVSIPLLALLVRFATQGFGANPIEELTHVTGEWGLRCVLLSLAVTPARRYFGWRWAAPLRRTLGLAGFGYASLHLATWALLDLGLEGSAILEDLTERPYVMVGMGSFTILLALAITSTRSAMKRLGKHWRELHRLVYLAAILAVVHHFWLTKADLQVPLFHATWLAGLFAARLAWHFRRPLQRSDPPGRSDPRAS